MRSAKRVPQSGGGAAPCSLVGGRCPFRVASNPEFIAITPASLGDAGGYL
jgi:hypothetical protein